MTHIQKKNPYFDGTVRISWSFYDSLDHCQHQVLASPDLEIDIN